MPWINGGPSRTSSPQWRKIRAQAITRDGNHCTNCGADGRQTPLYCDHIVPVAEGGTDTLDNARMLCSPCHDPKTRAEAARGRARRAARSRMPTSNHPGLNW